MTDTRTMCVQPSRPACNGLRRRRHVRQRGRYAAQLVTATQRAPGRGRRLPTDWSRVPELANTPDDVLAWCLGASRASVNLARAARGITTHGWGDQLRLRVPPGTAEELERAAELLAADHAYGWAPSSAVLVHLVLRSLSADDIVALARRGMR